MNQKILHFIFGHTANKIIGSRKYETTENNSYDFEFQCECGKTWISTYRTNFLSVANCFDDLHARLNLRMPKKQANARADEIRGGG